MNGSLLDGSFQPPKGCRLRMRIALTICSLEAGGAERVLSGMANYWADTNNHSVAVITLSGAKSDWYPLHPKVERRGLDLLAQAGGISDALTNNLRRVWHLRRYLKQFRPDVVISFIEKTNILTLLACAGQKVPVIVSERADPREKPIDPVWHRLRTWTYAHADAIVVQSSSLQEWASKFAGAKVVHVVPNPIRPLMANTALSRSRNRTVIAMGRLTRQKGFDLLLAAFAQCRKRYPEWRLMILGEGEERHELEALSTRLGLQEYVRFPGLVKTPEDELCRADLFVLSSRWEGFPNALLEAMACGLPVVATNCLTGPADIISDGKDGVLVAPNDVGALAMAMSRLMGEEAVRQELGRRAPEVLNRFNQQAVMVMWEQLLDGVQLGRSNQTRIRA